MPDDNLSAFIVRQIGNEVNPALYAAGAFAGWGSAFIDHG
jgi:hypothetical protein